jgi:predicted  nucleic acid-binding Zn-ribbon protein
MSQNNPLSKVIGVILVIVIIVFAVFWVQTSGHLSDNQTTIASLNTQLSGVQSQVGTDQSQISALSSQLTAAQTQLSTTSSTAASLKTQLTTDETTISSLSGQITAANSKIADLTTQFGNTGSGIAGIQNQVAKDATTIANLQTQLTTATGQITAATSQISTLQTQLSTLQTQVSSGTGSGTSQQTILSGQAFTLSGGQQTLLTSFNAASSGSLIVSGSTTTITGYLRINNSVYGSSTNYPFNGASVSIPIQAGSNSLYMGDNDATGSIATATMNAYVGNGASGTGAGQTTLLTSQVFTLFGGQQSLITSFNASGAGILLISGSINSITSYLRLNNSTYGSSSNYPFANGSTVSIPFQIGNNTLYMGNQDPPGTSPIATLNAYLSYSGGGTGTGTAQTTILSAQGFTLTPGGQTLLTSFNASSSGSLTVTGSTTSTTGYVRVYNSVYGGSTNYTFANGSTISIPVQSGYNTIYFGNSDASAQSVTLSATFIY